jgi:hypothetical protein
MLLIYKLLVVDHPGPVVPHNKKLRMQFSTGSTAGTQAVIYIEGQIFSHLILLVYYLIPSNKAATANIRPNHKK